MENDQNSRLNDDFLLAAYCNSVGSSHGQMGDHAGALPYFLKALEIQQRILPENDVNIAVSCNNVGAVYNNLGDSSKARSFIECAINIGQQSLPENDHELQKWKRNLDKIDKP
ncbi:unnamed protein product [Adineta ricciae]|uniref:Tetratricopeptide repeat protein n=1 Tax=Adineta ricciae TaxID=249248 RepID=A0A814RCX1_ADIRI|nr:unnamed protein product [Adineta ricciae]CAF1529279.1 unnamed protein product [Adineta ricciae]